MNEMEYAAACGTEDRSEEWAYQELILEEQLIQEASKAMNDLAEQSPEAALNIMIDVGKNITRRCHMLIEASQPVMH